MAITPSTDGDDNIVGESTGDTINGRGGNDTIDGSGGEDIIYGGSGNDNLSGDGAVAAGAQAVLISTDFEDDAEGWTVSQTQTGAGSTDPSGMVYLSTGGVSPNEPSPDGALRAFDTQTGADYFVASSEWHGDLSEAVNGNLSFWVFAKSTATIPADNLGRGIIISGTDASGNPKTIIYNQQLDAPANTAWTNLEVDLTAANFSVSEADFEAVMSSVTDFRILGEYWTGANNDNTAIDHIVLTSGPLGADDYIDGGTGDDIIDGEDGADVLIGGIGNDTITGGDGDDLIYGEGDTDVLLAQSSFTNDAEGWTVSGTASGAQSGAGYNNTDGTAEITFDDASGGTGYFHANDDFIGDLSTAYGGRLEFSQYLDLNGGNYDNAAATQIYILGPLGYMAYTGPEFVLVDGEYTDVSVQIVEGFWSIGGVQATEAQIRDTLANAQDVLIKAEYSTIGGDGSALSNVSLFADATYAVDVPDGGTETNFNDVIDGEAGSDTVYAGAGNDIVTDSGTTGDTIYGQGGDDDLDGGLGDDTVDGGEGSDNVKGGEGNDLLSGGSEDDIIDGGAGNDVIYGDTATGGNFVLRSGAAYSYQTNFTDGTSYILNSEHHYDSVQITGDAIGVVFTDDDPLSQGDDGTNEIQDDSTQKVTINGETYDYFLEQVAIYFDGNSTFASTFVPGSYATTDDLIAALDAAGEPYYIFADIDVDYNRDGTFNAGSRFEDGSLKVLVEGDQPPVGVDLRAGMAFPNEPLSYETPDGDDVITGGEGDDVIYGEGGNDTISGDAGADVIEGGEGDDIISGNAGFDTIDGGVGNDNIMVGSGDNVQGGDDRDTFTLDASQLDPSNTTFTIDGGTGSTADNDVDDFDTIKFGALKIVPGSLVQTADGDLSNSTSGSVQVTDGTNIYTVNFSEIEQIICFARGTEIETMDGPVKVEAIKQGDLILTKDSGFQPVAWIGSKARNRISVSDLTKLAPVRIASGALGNGLPKQDLYVSPQHRILVRSSIARRMFGAEEVLVPAKKLLGLDGIEQVFDFDEVEYFHFLFERHQIVYANGAEAESLFTGPEALKAVSAEAREEILSLFPELANCVYHDPARPLPTGRKVQKMASRHQKNQVPLQQ